MHQHGVLVSRHGKPVHDPPLVQNLAALGVDEAGTDLEVRPIFLRRLHRLKPDVVRVDIQESVDTLAVVG